MSTLLNYNYIYDKIQIIIFFLSYQLFINYEKYTKNIT